MNKDLFDSMQKQMRPSPEVRAVLAEKLAQPVKRRIPVRKYAAVAACAALVIGGLSVYSLYQDQARWMLITRNFHRDVIVSTQHLHSYVLVDGLDTGISLNGEDATVEFNEETGAEDIYYSGAPERDSGTPSATETAPAPGRDTHDGHFYISQDEAIKLYDILWNHFCEKYSQQEETFNPNWPDWYGGGYLNNDRSDHIARLTLVLVEDYDTPALRQEIYDFLGSDHVDFQTGKYALSYLLDLQKKISDHPVIREVFASSGTDEENNRLNLTLTEVTDVILMALAELDPDDDAICVQTGRRITLDVAVEDPAPIMPGGAVVPEDDENLIAIEPWADDKDGAWYSLLEQKQPTVVQSVPEEEDLDPSTAVTYNPRTGETIVRRDSNAGSEKSESASTPAYNPDR